MTPLEEALVLLARKTVEQPRLLRPADLAPLQNLIGDSALDYVQVIVSFHYVNCMANLLGVNPETVPRPFLRFESLRTLIIRAMAFLLRSMKLDSLEYGKTYAEVLDQITPVIRRSTGRNPSNEFEVFKARPQLIEYVQLLIEDRLACLHFGREMIERVQRTVEAALVPVLNTPPRGAGPIESFAYLGTRYPYRATPAQVAALRTAGFDDVAILELASLIASCNAWARIYRLFGLDPGLFYLAEVDAAEKLPGAPAVADQLPDAR